MQGPRFERPACPLTRGFEISKLQITSHPLLTMNFTVGKKLFVRLSDEYESRQQSHRHFFRKFHFMYQMIKNTLDRILRRTTSTNIMNPHVGLMV